MRNTYLTGWLSAVLCIAAPVFAQNASVSGSVIDVQNASVPKAAVTFINTETKVQTGTSTDRTGNFILPPLEPGHYDVRAAAAGFAPTELTGITLEVGESKVLTIRVKLGSTESIVVSTTPPEMTTDRADRSLMIEPTFVGNIPLEYSQPAATYK